jgi:prevent-host-death family protein
MTMKRRRSIAASRFKAECLNVLDRVSERRETYVVTKRGRPVAQVSPVDAERKPLAGSVTVTGDIVAPVLEDWEVDR